MMWTMGITPEMLSLAITCLIHKKGPTDDIRNYRPITLLNTLHKIWERVLEQRLRKIVHTMHAQMGSKPDNSATTATMMKRSLYRLARLLDMDIHSLQIDLSKAYNRVDRHILWNKLAKLGVKGKLWSAIISTYANAQDQIRIGQRYSDPFHLKFGLRQGSILSPILFIIYVNDLILALEETNTGAHGSADDMTLKVASIMFVDDIETYTHNMEDIKTQFDTAIQFARTHRAVLNIIKSTITSSKGSTAAQAMKNKTGIDLKVQSTTTQLGTRINAKEMRYPDKKRPSTDVSTRCGITNSMTATMTARGLKAGDMTLPDMSKVLKSITAPTLTFGLASTDLTRTDKHNLRQTMANTTVPVLGMKAGTDPTNTWAMLEIGVTDPVDQITITDWTTVIKMMQGKSNPLARKVIAADSTLKTALEKVKNLWKFTPKNLARIPSKQRNTWLQAKARTHRLQQTNGTHFNPNGTPVWLNSSLTHQHITLLVQYRCLRAQGRLSTVKHCVLCNTTNIEQPTITHYLHYCHRGAEVTGDTERHNALKPSDQTDWASLDEAAISELCAHPQRREYLLTLALDTLHHCKLFETDFIT